MRTGSGCALISDLTLLTAIVNWWKQVKQSVSIQAPMPHEVKSDFEPSWFLHDNWKKLPNFDLRCRSFCGCCWWSITSHLSNDFEVLEIRRFQKCWCEPLFLFKSTRFLNSIQLKPHILTTDCIANPMSKSENLYKICFDLFGQLWHEWFLDLLTFFKELISWRGLSFSWVVVLRRRIFLSILLTLSVDWESFHFVLCLPMRHDTSLILDSFSENSSPELIGIPDSSFCCAISVFDSIFSPSVVRVFWVIEWLGHSKYWIYPSTSPEVADWHLLGSVKTFEAWRSPVCGTEEAASFQVLKFESWTLTFFRVWSWDWFYVFFIPVKQSRCSIGYKIAFHPGVDCLSTRLSR